MTPRRPLLRYHGGKWKLAPQILRYFPPHRIYCEPFGGGASILLRKPRTYAEIYNDLDGELVNLFRIVREHGKELAARVSLTPFARDEYRRSFQPSDDPIEQARRTLVRSHMGFGTNSLARHVKSGFRAYARESGTHPARDWSQMPAVIEQVTARLRGVVIENRDAMDLMRVHDGPDTLHYCDPPYLPATRSALRFRAKGYTHDLTESDHRALAETARGMRGMVIVSGYASDLYDAELFADWDRITIPALADGARKRSEILWLNAAAAASIVQGRLIQ